MFKDDRLDAQTLGRLARIDPQLLCPAKHRSAKAQADLSVFQLSPISRTLRARAAITSCPNSLNNRLTHGECIPVSSAIVLPGISPNNLGRALAVVEPQFRDRSRNLYPVAIAKYRAFLNTKPIKSASSVTFFALARHYSHRRRTR